MDGDWEQCNTQRLATSKVLLVPVVPFAADLVVCAPRYRCQIAGGGRRHCAGGVDATGGAAGNAAHIVGIASVSDELVVPIWPKRGGCRAVQAEGRRRVNRQLVLKAALNLRTVYL